MGSWWCRVGRKVSSTPTDRRVVNFTKTGKPVKHGTPSGYRYHGCRCDPCTQAYRKRQRDWMQRNPGKKSLQNSRAYKKRTSTLEGLALNRLKAARSNARRKGLEFDIDLEWVIDKIKHLRCEVLGCDLTITQDVDGLTNPFTPSLDRRDNSKGYTKDNVQVVAWFFNRLKGEWPEGVVDRILRVIKHSHKLQ
jgi:hypothetical protein